MDVVVAWTFWLLKWVLSLAWSLAWLLLGGWVSTLAQIVALLAVLAVYRFGWRRAPLEVWSQLSNFARLLTNWLRGRELLSNRPSAQRQISGTEKVRIIRIKEVGDFNLSTGLSLLLLTGLTLLAAVLH